MWGFESSAPSLKMAATSAAVLVTMLEIIDEGGVDLKDDEEILIDKKSLVEYQEAVAEYEYYFG